MVVSSGDIITVPRHSSGATKITITWKQRLLDRHADYYVLVGKSKSKPGEEFPLYIAAEWYETPKEADDHLGHAAENYEIVVNERLQYGQKNDKGEGRFVVYHDEGRKVFQHRFLETTLAAKAATLAVKLADLLGYSSAAGPISSYLRSWVGDYLHTFETVPGPKGASADANIPNKV